jgi:hypothetical protein
MQRHNSAFQWHKFIIYEYKGFGITMKSPSYNSFVFMFIYIFYFEFHVYYLHYHD